MMSLPYIYVPLDVLEAIQFAWHHFHKPAFSVRIRQSVDFIQILKKRFNGLSSVSCVLRIKNIHLSCGKEESVDMNHLPL